MHLLLQQFRLHDGCPVAERRVGRQAADLLGVVTLAPGLDARAGLAGHDGHQDTPAGWRGIGRGRLLSHARCSRGLSGSLTLAVRMWRGDDKPDSYRVASAAVGAVRAKLKT